MFRQIFAYVAGCLGRNKSPLTEAELPDFTSDGGGYGTPPEPRRVIWEMDYQDGTKEMIFEDHLALAALLMAEKVGINSNWFRKDLSESDQKSFTVFVNCSDVFMWGCGDAEDLPYDDLQSLYEMWVKDPAWGTAVWCMQQRKMLPQGPVAKRIRQAGIWDIDNMGLRSSIDDAVNAKYAAAYVGPILSWENEGGMVRE